ncbi:MAG: cytochrome P450 [Gloeomargarita sp. HHBFW_bins_162]
MGQLPPGRFSLPFIGETLEFFSDPEFARKRHHEFGEIFRTNLLGQNTIFIKGVAANQFILENENRYFQVTWPPSTRMLLGNLSLALQTGEQHQSRRKILVQAFMPRALSSYIPTIESITASYCNKWHQQREFAWYPELRNYTLDIACKLLVGIDQGSRTRLGQLFETWCQGLFSIPIDLPWTAFGKAKLARKLLLEELEAIIKKRTQDTSTSLSPTNALDLLVHATDEEGKKLELEELKDQVLLLLFAGHETLTSAIASFCLLVPTHSEVLTKLRLEQVQFQREPLTLETLKKMTYLEQVLKEVMRKIPPVGGGFRTVVQTCEYKGYQIPKNWNVLYQIGLTHADENLYPQPTEFNPERFTEERSQAPKYGYIPFGGGIRECLGKEFARLEMKLFATYLLRHTQWELLPNQDLNLVTVPTPHPRDGLRVKFQVTNKAILSIDLLPDS